MKKLRFVLIFLVALACLACTIWAVRVRYFARADYYASLEYLGYYLNNLESKNANFIISLKKTVERLGNPNEGLALIKEAERIKHKTQALCNTLKRTTQADTNRYSLYDITNFREGRQAIDSLRKYEQYIKTKYPFASPTLGNLTDERYLRTQSVAETQFIINDLSTRLLVCERTILDRLLTQFEAKIQPLNIVPVVRSKKATYYEGETFEGTLHLLNPIRFKKGEAKATINGKSVEVGEDGIARIALPVGKAGKYDFEGTFSCKYHGQDTIFRLKQTIDVYKK